MCGEIEFVLLQFADASEVSPEPMSASRRSLVAALVREMPTPCLCAALSELRPPPRILVFVSLLALVFLSFVLASPCLYRFLRH